MVECSRAAPVNSPFLRFFASFYILIPFLHSSMAIFYTRMQLVSLSPGLQSFLDENLWRSLVKFGISRARPTRRGCRTGLRKQLRPSISRNLIHTSEAFQDTSNVGSVLFSSI